MNSPRPRENSQSPEAALAQANQSAKALNDGKFVEFLDQTGVELSDSDPSEIIKYYEAFKNKGEVAKALEYIYKQELSQNTKGAVGLPAEARIAIDAYLEKQIAQNPDSLGEMLQTITEYHEINEEVKAREQVIKEAEERETAFEKQQEALRKQKGLFGALGVNAARAKLREMRSSTITGFAGVKHEINSLKHKERAIAELGEVKGKLAAIKGELFQNSELSKVLNEIVSKQVREHLVQDNSNFSLEGLEKQLELLEHLQDLDDSNEPGNLNYLAGVKAPASPEHHRRISDKLDKAIAKKLRDTIEEEFIKNTPTLSKVVKLIENHIAKRKSIGSNKGLTAAEIMQKLILEMLTDGTVASLPAGKRLVFKQMANQMAEKYNI
jgi:hypothetical protein